MIISPGRRYIFVHAPKTGGTALTLALEARAMKDDILIGDTPKAKRRRKRLAAVKTAGRLWKHSTLADIDGLLSVAELERYFIFMLVRNPWDRMVSYYHWLRAQGFEHPAVALSRQLDFADFVAHPLTRTTMQAAPYGHYLRDAQGRERGTFLRLEHLAQDAGPLVAHLGFGLDDIPRANASQHDPDYRLYYSKQTADLVAQMCRQDIDRFGYSFE